MLHVMRNKTWCEIVVTMIFTLWLYLVEQFHLRPFFSSHQEREGFSVWLSDFVFYDFSDVTTWTLHGETIVTTARGIVLRHLGGDILVPLLPFDDSLVLLWWIALLPAGRWTAALGPHLVDGPEIVQESSGLVLVLVPHLIQGTKVGFLMTTCGEIGWTTHQKIIEERGASLIDHCRHWIWETGTVEVDGITSSAIEKGMRGARYLLHCCHHPCGARHCHHHCLCHLVDDGNVMWERGAGLRLGVGHHHLKTIVVICTQNVDEMNHVVWDEIGSMMCINLCCVVDPEDGFWF